MLSEEVSLKIHLEHNHYPPVGIMFDAAQEAIEAGREGDWDREISLPDGILYHGTKESAPAHEIIEWLHLDFYLPQEEFYE